jgi:hypothetical protein
MRRRANVRRGIAFRAFAAALSFVVASSAWAAVDTATRATLTRRTQSYNRVRRVAGDVSGARMGTGSLRDRCLVLEAFGPTGVTARTRQGRQSRAPYTW